MVSSLGPAQAPSLTLQSPPASRSRPPVLSTKTPMPRKLRGPCVWPPHPGNPGRILLRKPGSQISSSKSFPVLRCGVFISRVIKRLTSDLRSRPSPCRTETAGAGKTLPPTGSPRLAAWPAGPSGARRAGAQRPWAPRGAHPAGPLCWGPAWLREGRRHHLLGTRGPAAVAVVGRGPNAPSRPRCPACPRPVPGGRRVRRRAARPHQATYVYSSVTLAPGTSLTFHVTSTVSKLKLTMWSCRASPGRSGQREQAVRPRSRRGDPPSEGGDSARLRGRRRRVPDLREQASDAAPRRHGARPETRPPVPPAPCRPQSCRVTTARRGRGPAGPSVSKRDAGSA